MITRDAAQILPRVIAAGCRLLINGRRRGHVPVRTSSNAGDRRAVSRDIVEGYREGVGWGGGGGGLSANLKG